MKIIVEMGAPGSGKTFCSRKRCIKDKKFVRVNRDDLRTMGFGLQYWNKDREKWIEAMEESAAELAIKSGFSPIIDSTNLKPARVQKWQEFAKARGVQFEVCDHTKVAYRTLIESDALRMGSSRVGQVVIDRMLATAGLLPKPTRPVVICDVDGTVANLEHRKFLLEKGTKNWHMFFGLVTLDAPIEKTITLVRELALENDIWVVSGRPDFHVEGDDVHRTGDDTVTWLHTHNVPFKHIFMRKVNDHRPDTEVKRDILEHEILKNISLDQIKCVVDDRPSVIRMWKEQGLTVIDVGDGIEF